MPESSRAHRRTCSDRCRQRLRRQARPTVYYNELDHKACAWLQELQTANQIPRGMIDWRDLRHVKPSLLRSVHQAHFFAGIGGWAYALRLVHWPEDVPIWTASLPCQPFSTAGKRRGHRDKRHLWPVFRNLVKAAQPPVIVGEQVASAAGRDWLAGVFADLEGMGYRTDAADLCAAGIGAPHIRQRLYWMADAPGRWQRSHRDEVQRALGGCGSIGHAWQGAKHIECADGKARPIEPGIEPLAERLPGHMDLLRGAGNAIVPQVAAAFLCAAFG